MQFDWLKLYSKNVLIFLLTIQMSLSPYAHAQKAPADMEKKFNAIVKEFKKNPSYASAAKAKQALWDLNNKNPFVSDNNEAAFSRKYEAFQLQMEEVTVATESLGKCAGKDPALQRKVMNIGDAFASSIAKTKPDETQTKSFKEMNTMSAANGCTSIKPGQVVSPKQLANYKLLQKAFNDHNAKYAGKTAAEREAMDWRARNGLKDFRDYPGKTFKEKIAAMEKEKKSKAALVAKGKSEIEIQKKSLVKVDGFAGSEVRNHIRDKFGFVMSDKEKKQTAEKLHLSLMAGNRENALRNYMYFSQRFDFSGEDDLTQYSDSRLRDMSARQGSIMFQANDWQGYQQLKDEDLNRLGVAGAKEIEAYKKKGKSQKLSVDDVYARLLPYLKDGGYTPPEDLNKPIQPMSEQEIKKALMKSSVNVSESTSNIQNYHAKQNAQFMFQQQRYNKMISNAEKGEVGFLLQSKDFDKFKNRGLTGLSKAQIMTMIKSSLKEKIQDTKDYSKNFIRKYQTTKNLWGDRGVEGLADIGKTLIYSSPTVIYDTIAKNPKLMGSMCLPLQHAAKEKDLTLPSYVKFGGGMMSAVPVGGQVAGFAVGTTFGVAMAAEYRYRMAGKLSGDAKVAGLGNHHSRGQEEARADKTELKRAAKAHKDQLVNDAAEITRDNAIAAVGGNIVGKTFKGAVTTRTVTTVAAKETNAAGEVLVNSTKASATRVIAKDAETLASSKVTSAAGQTEQKSAWLKDLDNGVGGKTGTMSDEANKSWSEFKELAKQKAGKNYDELTDDLFGVHTTGNSASGKVTYRKKVSLVELKAKLKSNGFSDAEANYWAKDLADKQILGEFNTASKVLPDEELWKVHAKKTYDGKANVPSDKYAPLVKAGQRDEAFEKAYQELQDLKQATNQLKANSKTPMQAQVNASSDARALEKYLNDHFPDKMAAATTKVETQAVVKPDFDDLYGKFKNASGQERTNLQIQLENNFYKDFKTAQQEVKLAKEAEAAKNIPAEKPPATFEETYDKFKNATGAEKTQLQLELENAHMGKFRSAQQEAKAAREAEKAAEAAKQPVDAPPTFEKALDDYKNATGQDRINIQLWLEKNHYKEFKEAVKKKP